MGETETMLHADPAAIFIWSNNTLRQPKSDEAASLSVDGFLEVATISSSITTRVRSSISLYIFCLGMIP